MQNLLFKSIWILSRKHKTARVVDFHPNSNLLVGRNHTGKSSLIKTLFVTLGAKPAGKLEKWDQAVVSVVKLSVNGNDCTIVHQAGNRAVFDSQEQLVGIASDHRGWSEIFAKVVGFNLVVLDKNANAVTADPKCFFLVHYINQDGSWSGKWDTFQGLQQYSNPIGSILEYFSGIRPPEFYQLDAQKRILVRRIDEGKKEQEFLQRARRRLEVKLPLSGAKINSENFQKELDLLTSEVTDLNSQQEELRDRIVRERELFQSIQLQINLAATVLSSYDKDAGFLQTQNAELICPTCGAEHEEPFIDILEYAEDARVLRELVTGLRTDLNSSKARVVEAENALQTISSNYQRVSSVLATRKGELELGEVLAGMGAEEAFAAFQDELELLRSEQFAFEKELNALDVKIKAVTSRDRTSAILTEFRAAYGKALSKLNLPAKEMKGVRLTSRPDLSGSGGPRQVLAYYSALWVVSLGKYGGFNLPIVIDSPNQQGQDEINLPAILEFISEGLPKQAQVIVGSEIDSEKPFDHVVQLDVPYGLLNEGEFEDVSKLAAPYEAKLFGELL